MLRPILAVGAILMLAFLCFGVLAAALMRLAPPGPRPSRVASTAPEIERTADAVLHFTLTPASTTAPPKQDPSNR